VTCSATPHPLGIALRGEIDVALEDHLGAVLSFLSHSTRSDVAVCVHDVTFLDSTGLDFLVRVQRHVRSAQTSLCLVAPSSTVRWVLRVAGLTDAFAAAEPDSEAARTCACVAPRAEGLSALMPLQLGGDVQESPGAIDGLAS
jgi:anti-anti-sigma factor